MRVEDRPLVFYQHVQSSLRDKRQIALNLIIKSADAIPARPRPSSSAWRKVAANGVVRGDMASPMSAQPPELNLSQLKWPFRLRILGVKHIDARIKQCVCHSTFPFSEFQITSMPSMRIHRA
jgi:hypothetical protein